MKQRRPPPKRAAKDELPSQALAEVVRAQLVTLGDFGHLHVRHDGKHLLVEQPGPPDDPDDRWAVLRLTPLGGLPPQFGLSFATHDGRWEKMPVSGLLADVLSTAVQLLAPYLAPDSPLGDTSGTDN